MVKQNYTGHLINVVSDNAVCMLNKGCFYFRILCWILLSYLNKTKVINLEEVNSLNYRQDIPFQATS